MKGEFKPLMTCAAAGTFKAMKSMSAFLMSRKAELQLHREPPLFSDANIAFHY